MLNTFFSESAIRVEFLLQWLSEALLEALRGGGSDCPSLG